MNFFDVNGRRINWGDRFTRNAVIVAVIVIFGLRVFMPYFKEPVYEDKQSEALILCLVGAINLIFGYFLGRNQNQVEERPNKPTE